MKRGSPLKRYTPLRKVRPASGLRRSKSKTNYKKRLWEAFSLYIRKKYADHAGYVTCVSCGAVKFWKQIHSGHYIAKNMGDAIYFEEKNVHPQCYYCNVRRHGNGPMYALFLIKTYGAAILDELEAMRRTEAQLREPWYLEKIEYYREQAKKYSVPEAA